MEKIAKFAEDELALSVINGGSGLGAGLPLTDNQKQKGKQQKEAEEKRAATIQKKLVASIAPQLTPTAAPTAAAATSPAELIQTINASCILISFAVLPLPILTLLLKLLLHCGVRPGIAS